MHCKLLVVSDSHGDWKLLGRIAEREAPFDAIIHCGDGADDLSRIALAENTRIIRVAGNVDRGRGYAFDRMAVETLCQKKIMVTHGDLFKVEHGLMSLLDEAMRSKVDLVCFGHTHMKFYHDGIPAFFNPGPANAGLYGVITINGDMLCQHRHLHP
jgi:putative phosphoesterase